MFATLEGTVDHACERRREARRCELRSLSAQEARIKQRVTQIVREADDEGDWQAAGCASSAQWLAQLSGSEHRNAAQITRTSDALRELPALDHALSSGTLTLDQVTAAAQHATPASDAQLARIAVGKAPSLIALAARSINPPTLADDEELYQRRALSMTWTRGRRELAFSGRLPLEHGAAFEQAIWSIAKPQRAHDKQAGILLDWQQSAADALLTLTHHSGAANGSIKRSPTTLIVHHSARRTTAARRRRPTQPRNRRTTRLRRTPPHHQTHGPRPRALARHTLRLLRTTTRAAQTLTPLPIPRLHRCPRARGTPPRTRRARRQDRTRQPHPALPPPPQTPPRPPHPHQRPQPPTHLHRPNRTHHHQQPATRTTRQSACGAEGRGLDHPDQLNLPSGVTRG